MNRIKTGSLVLAGIVGVLVAWGLLEPRLWLDERHVQAELAGLEERWHDQEVAMIADLQVGMWLSNDRMIERAVERIVERRARAVLVAGDFVYHPEKNLGEQLARLEELFRPLAEASIPVYGVLGNHDWGMSDRSQKNARPDVARRVRAELKRIGIMILENERASLDLEGEHLELVGLGSHWAGRDRAADALAGLSPDVPRIVFMHHPDSFESIPPGAAPFAIAAHTHGGQLRIPFLPQWSWMTFVVADEVHADGWIDDGYGRPGNRLYVNRGIGFSRFPLRLNAPPELTFVRLRRADPGPGRADPSLESAGE